MALVLLLVPVTTATAAEAWRSLPQTLTRPPAVVEGKAPVKGVEISYAEYGAGQPVILLHAGLANSNYWGNLIPALSPHYRVIVMDSRGHGRSTRDSRPYSYDLMASDALGLMDYVKIQKADIVGWSDGATIWLDIAMNYPDRIGRLFSFAANPTTAGLKPGRIVLLAFDVGLHVARRLQPDIVPERAQLSCPIVPGGTRLDADPTGTRPPKTVVERG